MRSIASLILILFFACPTLIAQVTPAAQKGMIKPMAIAWTGLPEGLELEMRLFHPEGHLGKLVVSDHGEGRGEISGYKSHVLGRSNRIKKALFSFDAELFELRDLEGLWVAKRTFPDLQPGERKSPLLYEFHWEPTGILEFDGDVEPVRKRSHYSGELRYEVPYVTASIRVAGSKEDPIRYSIRRPLKWLAPGEYEVVLTSPSHLKQAHRVEIVGGKTKALVFHMPHTPKLRDVEISVLAGSGPLPWMESGERELWGISVWAWKRQEPEGLWIADFESVVGCANGREDYQPILWKEEGNGYVGRAMLFDIPQGELDLEVHCGSAGFHTKETHSPNGDISLVITLYRGLDGPGWGFVEKEATGQGRARSRYFGNSVVYEPTASHTPRPLHAFVGKSLFVPDRFERAPSRWAYCVNGYLPVYGTTESFVVSGEGRRMAEIELKPGYGTEILVVDTQGRPIAGAEILADGVNVGRSNVSGIAQIRMKNAPRVLCARSGDRTKDHGLNPLEPLPWHRFELAPDAKK